MPLQSLKREFFRCSNANLGEGGKMLLSKEGTHKLWVLARCSQIHFHLSLQHLSSRLVTCLQMGMAHFLPAPISSSACVKAKFSLRCNWSGGFSSTVLP